MTDERRPHSYIEKVEVHDLRASNSSQISMKIIAGKDVCESPIFNVQSESIPVWLIGLSVGNLNASTVIEFKLFSHRKFHPWSRKPLLGHAMNVISEMCDSSYTTVSLISNTFPRSVICTLKVFWSDDLKQAAKDRVEETAEPETPLARVAELLDDLEPIKRMIDSLSEVHPAARIAWGLLSSGFNILKKQAETDNLVVGLYEDMRSAYDQASSAEVLRKKDELRPVYDSLFKQTIECSYFIEMYEKKTVTDRLLGRKLSDKAKEFSAGFEKLRHQLHHRIAEENIVVTLGIQQDVAKLDIQNVLNDLRPPKMLKVKSKCLKGTRTETINYLMDWVAKCTGGGVLWCSGLAGTGKSSLVGTLHEHLTVLGGRDRLGAFVRYDRIEYSDASHLLTSIAYSLGTFDPRIGAVMALAMQKRRSVIGLSAASALQQFEVLFRRPFEVVQDLATEGPIVVIIDGLDESDITKEMLAVLFQGFGSRLPFMRLLIFSRPVENILQSFRLADETVVSRLALDSSTEQSAHVKRDIKYFISAKFDELYLLTDTTFKNVCEERHAVEELTLRASGLFIWAATVCKFISGFPCVQRLNALLDISIPTSAIQSLTNLYRTALDTILFELEPDDIKDVRECILRVLGAVMVARTPPGMTADLLDALVLTPGHDPLAQHVLEKLGSVVQSNEESGDFIRLIHKSFDDFLKDPSRREPRWFIDIEDHRNKFARQCLSCLTTFLADWVPPNSANTFKQYRDSIPCHIRDYALFAPLWYIGWFHDRDSDDLRILFEDQLSFWIQLAFIVGKRHALLNEMAEVRLGVDRLKDRDCGFLPLVYHARQHAELELSSSSYCMAWSGVEMAVAYSTDSLLGHL